LGRWGSNEPEIRRRFYLGSQTSSRKMITLQPVSMVARKPQHDRVTPIDTQSLKFQNLYG
jgi:hypothetical protein